MNIEQLRREVVKAAWMVSRIGCTDTADALTANLLRYAFEDYDKAVIAANKPTFEGDEAEVARLRGLLRWAHDTLYEINPANYDHDEVCKLNDASVEVIIGIAPEIGETHGKPSEWWADRASPSAKLERAEAALAERDKAIAEARRRADEPETPDWISEPLRPFLPAKPAVDPLVEVLEAAGYAVFPEDLERVRAAIERAGGVKAVFGEGLE